MFKQLFSHKTTKIAFAAGLTVTSLVGGALHASAVTTPLPSNSLYSAPQHGLECAYISGSGTGQAIASGYKNSALINTATIVVECPLDGNGNTPFATQFNQVALPHSITGGDAVFADVVDANNNSANNAIIASSCYSNRAMSGGGCGEVVSTNTSTGQTIAEYTTLELTIPAGLDKSTPSAQDDNFAGRYIQLTLPPVDITSSHIRSYGLGYAL
jgi:hypothetical protein